MVPKGPLGMPHLLDLYYQPKTLINTSLLGLCDVIEPVWGHVDTPAMCFQPHFGIVKKGRTVLLPFRLLNYRLSFIKSLKPQQKNQDASCRLLPSCYFQAN